VKPLVVVSFTALWPNTWEKQLKGRKHLFWLTISEGLVPWSVVSIVSGCGKAEHHGGRSQRSRAAYLMAAWKGRVRESTQQEESPGSCFLQLSPHLLMFPQLPKIVPPGGDQASSTWMCLWEHLISQPKPCWFGMPPFLCHGINVI
jgi:hypothetical protein